VNKNERNEKQDTVTVRAFSLYQRDWDDITRFSTETGIRNMSAALRAILQEWRDLRTQPSCAK
jgi:hypothetical protein